MSIKDDLRPAPVKNYTPPKLPTLEEAGSTPLLKALPSRWKKNAAVITCLGLAGVFALSGCGRIIGDRPHHGGFVIAPFYIAHPTESEVTETGYHHGGDSYAPFYVTNLTEQEILSQIQTQLETADLELRVHWGGSGSGPFYVAHITEQEVLGFIRARLEAAGLNFDSAPPEYTIFGPDDMSPRPGLVAETGIDLFDAGRRIAIISLSWEDSTMHFSPQGQEFANIIANEFSERMSGISFGVFYNPGRFISEGTVDWENDEMTVEMEEVTQEEKDAARVVLAQQLTAQIDRFIAGLQ